MRKFLPFIFTLAFFSSQGQQYSLYTYYACCSSTTGEFAISGGPIDSVVWSNGARGTHITNVDTGNYDAYIYFQGVAQDTLGGHMFHDTWQISLFACGNNFCYYIYLPLIGNSFYVHPNCAPFGSYKVIVWEDSIPIDTLTFTNFVTQSGIYTNSHPGHRYDMSIYDPVCQCYEGTWDNSVYPSTVILNLKAYLQGFYISGGEMQTTLFNLALNPNPAACDSVLVELHPSSNPNQVAATGSAILNKDGNVQVLFPSAGLMSQSHYIVIKHRNSIQTWSKNPVLFNSSPVTYDFSTAANKAFDDNQAKLKDGYYGIFSGDVSRDGAVDALDMTLIENDAHAGAYGYNLSDVTGDGASDSLDMTIVENNGNAGVFEVHP